MNRIRPTGCVVVEVVPEGLEQMIMERSPRGDVKASVDPRPQGAANFYPAFPTCNI